MQETYVCDSMRLPKVTIDLLLSLVEVLDRDGTLRMDLDT